MNVIKKPGVAAPPGVDGLLDVPYLEERAVLRDVLYHLVDEGLYDGPLQVTGILKLVEEPVVETTVKTVVNPEAFKVVGFLAEDGCGLGMEVAAGQDDLQIAEGELATAADEGGVISFVLVEHVPDTLCTFEVDGNLVGNEASEEALNDFTGLVPEVLETVTDLEGGFPRLDGGPVPGIEKLLKKEHHALW
jgi:hypothetical protein